MTDTGTPPIHRRALRVRLIHWDAAAGEVRATALRTVGYDVDYEAFTPATLSTLKRDTPAAVVVDLSRLPMQGRDVGLVVRASKATRHVPLVFVDGEPEKVARVQGSLPDAVYTSWSRIRTTLTRAIAHPPAQPVTPRSVLEGYSGTPLVKKLGIRPGMVVLLVNAPAGFEDTLGTLPGGTTVLRRRRGQSNLTLWFATSRQSLERRIDQVAGWSDHGAMWIIWPKKSAQVSGDLTQSDVRSVGLAAGLVDFKICAVDATWSGLRFVRRKAR